MPLITMISISKGKPAAIIVTVSEERYKLYMKDYRPIEYPISAPFFKKYLKKNKIKFEEIEGNSLVISKKPFGIMLAKDAAFLEPIDIKNILKLVKLPYSEFIDSYADKLKKVKTYTK